ncbi:FAD:protein FMN transferase, partial [Nitratireductor sp. ZSWI3]|uniref:FAD:protein FMN transferase n=1 Tax=Nitratireductor sp. ZSWI3 TaxID=2966359 RepID=UPI00215002A8
EWRGRALGAAARLTINHPDEALARRLIERVEAEVRRLERIFSLYLATSEISVLNRDGVLHTPSMDLTALIEASRHHWRETGGAFDPTVQPLWMAYRQHFAAGDRDEMVLKEQIAAALRKVGFDGVLADRNRVVFAGPGMGITLNGIAQGYITDRVVDMMRAAGLHSCLADLGECRALGAAADGSLWRVGIEDPFRTGAVAKVLEIRDRAVATSSPTGFRFEETGRFNHLIDPRSGLSARRYASVTVVAPRALEADALSTAFSLMAPEEIRDVVNGLDGVEVHLIDAGGGVLELRSA